MTEVMVESIRTALLMGNKLDIRQWLLCTRLIVKEIDKTSTVSADD